MQNPGSIQPIVAKLKDGRLVKIVALGDVAGDSPSCWAIDDNGKLGQQSTNALTVVDPHFLPPDSSRYSQFFARGGGV